MDRRSFLQSAAAAAAAASLPFVTGACGRSRSRPSAAPADSTRYLAPVATDEIAVHAFDGSADSIDTSASAWTDRLSGDAFEVLFEEATEPRHSSPLLDEKRTGTFVCAACRLPLFPSTTKYESGTGWPSFWAPLGGHIGTKRDTKLAVPRTEYHCRRCGGHQGHVFHDGPDPTGLRYCNNGLALAFVPEGEPLPPLRS
jgi:peptide-methionine (R)-S-oxide reductase